MALGIKDTGLHAPGHYVSGVMLPQGEWKKIPQLYMLTQSRFDFLPESFLITSLKTHTSHTHECTGKLPWY